jgi:hypothetical protein
MLFFCLSFCEQILQSVILFSAARAMGISAPAVYFLALSPLTLLLITLPISIHGIGVLEGSYILFFGLAGVSAAESLSMSLILRVAELSVLLPAGIVFIYDSASLEELRRRISQMTPAKDEKSCDLRSLGRSNRT